MSGTATIKENEGVFQGRVEFAPEFQIQEASGKMKAELRVYRTETWETGSREIHLSFGFFGKPADWLEKLDLRIGEDVRVTYNLGSYEKKDWETKEPTGKHAPSLKGYTVAVLGRADEKGKEAVRTDDINF